MLRFRVTNSMKSRRPWLDVGTYYLPLGSPSFSLFSWNLLLPTVTSQDLSNIQNILLKFTVSLHLLLFLVLKHLNWIWCVILLVFQNWLKTMDLLRNLVKTKTSFIVSAQTNDVNRTKVQILLKITSKHHLI